MIYRFIAVVWIIDVPQPISAQEFARLSALYRYGVLDRPSDPAIDLVVAELAASLDVPLAQLVFADLHRLHGSAGAGLPAGDIPRAGSLPNALLDAYSALSIPDFYEGRADRHGTLDGVPDLRAFLGVRLQTPAEDAIGVLFVADRRPRAFAPDDLCRIERARDDVMALLESRRRSRLDDATEALARVPFLEQVASVLTASRAGGQPVSLVLLDVLEVRAQLNAASPGLGRLMLQRIADLGREQVRSRDSFGRLDQDCFAVLLSDTDETGASVLERRLVANLAESWGALTPAFDLDPAVVGTATWRPGDPEDVDALLRAATRAFGHRREPERASLVA